ncbi:MAG: adenylosuccinate lyase, partial [Fusobacteriaceae bacterium]|nr:adenylosuccinate lyase [Fusobacteriaceae bacterium]
QAFLSIDAILLIWQNIMDGIVVYPKMIEKRIMSELPFMATEYIIMEGVTKGGDRQELHERIRMHSMEAGKNVKVEGKDNDLIERILADDYFNIDKTRLTEILDPKNFIGFAADQTVDFIKEEVQPIIDANKELLGLKADLHV